MYIQIRSDMLITPTKRRQCSLQYSPSSSVVIFTPQSKMPSRNLWPLINGNSSLTLSCSFSNLKVQVSAGTTHHLTRPCHLLTQVHMHAIMCGLETAEQQLSCLAPHPHHCQTTDKYACGGNTNRSGPLLSTSSLRCKP